MDRNLGMDISIHLRFGLVGLSGYVWVYLGHLRDMETGEMTFIKVSNSFGSFWTILAMFSACFLLYFALIWEAGNPSA